MSCEDFCIQKEEHAQMDGKVVKILDCLREARIKFHVM
jgi:hypothetical protein